MLWGKRLYIYILTKEAKSFIKKSSKDGLLLLLLPIIN